MKTYQKWTSRLSIVIIWDTDRHTDRQTRPKLYTTPHHGWPTSTLVLHLMGPQCGIWCPAWQQTRSGGRWKHLCGHSWTLGDVVAVLWIWCHDFGPCTLQTEWSCLRVKLPNYSSVCRLTEQDQSETACPPRRMVWIRSRILIRTPACFQNLIGTSLSKDTSVMNFHENSITISGDMRQIVKKMPYLAMLKNPWTFLDPDPDFQNLISFFSCTDTSVVKFSWRSVQ